MRIEHAIDIGATPERVWAIAVDVENWPRWTPTTERVTRVDEGPLRCGSAARIKQPGLPEALWTVDALDAESRVFAWSARVRGLNFCARHEVAPIPSGGARNRLVLEVGGPLAVLLWPLIKGKLTRALVQENEGLKAFAERSEEA